MFSTLMQVQFTGIPGILVYLTLPGIGVLFGFASLYLIQRVKEPSRMKDWLGMFGAVSGSPALGAVAQLTLEIRSVDILVSEAAFLTLTGTVASWLCIALFTPVLLCLTVLLPLAIRCGPRCAGQAIRHIYLHRDPRAAMAEFWTRFGADNAWDEFATALAEGLRFLDPANISSRLFASMTTAPKGSKGDDLLAEAALRLLARNLERPLEKFSVHTGANKFRFSLWRIASDGTKIERLWMLPDRDERLPIPLWKENEPGKPASHGADVLQKGEPGVLTAADRRVKDFQPGRIGTDYIAIRGCPITADGDDSPWGLLYIDLCHGSVPLDSDAVRLLSRRLVATVAPVGHILKRNTLKESFKS